MTRWLAPILLLCSLPLCGCGPILAGVYFAVDDGGSSGGGGSAPPSSPGTPAPPPPPPPPPAPAPAPPPGGGGGGGSGGGGGGGGLIAPLQPAVVAEGPNRVRVTWFDPNASEFGYSLEREVAPGVWAQVAATGADGTTALDLTVESNSLPVYRVRPLGFGATPGPASPSTVAVVTSAHFALVSEDQRRVYLLPGDALGAPRLLGVARGHTVKTLAGLSARFSPRGPTELIEFYETPDQLQAAFSLSRGKIVGNLTLDQGFEASRSGFARRIAGFDGTLVGVFGGTTLRRVDATTGVTTLAGTFSGPVGNEVVRALGFAGTALYAAASADGNPQAERLYEVDQSTAALTFKGPLGATGDLQTLAGTHDPAVLFGTDGAPGVVSKLYRIDPSTGTATELGSTGVTNVVGLAAVELPHPDAPRVSRAAPQTLATGTACTVALHGANLSGATVTSLHPGVTVLGSFESATGRALVASVRVSDGVSGGIPLQVSGGGRASIYVLDVLDASAPLVVANGTQLELGGTIRLPSLTVEAGGTLRGTGLEPLRLIVDGAVVIRGTLDVSGFDSGPIDATAPHVAAPGWNCHSGDGGVGGPGGGGGGGGGPTERTELTVGGWGGEGLTGGSGGGSSPQMPAAAGGFGLGTSGALGAVGGVGVYGTGGAGGRAAPAGVFGGTQAPGGGGGGGTGDPHGGSGGAGGAVANNPGPDGQGGGSGAWHTSNGCGAGGGGYGTQGNNGRLSQGSSTGGGHGGQAHGDVWVSRLAGGSGGAGGCGRGDFEGIGGGGGGGGGAVAVIAAEILVGATGSVRADGGSNRTHLNHDGEGGGGSGGAIVLHAPTVNLETGATVRAPGGVVENQGTRGLGGVGRIRVDAVRYQRDGADVTPATFATFTQPAVGFTGSTAPALSLPSAPAVNGAVVELQVQPNDADFSQVRLDVQFTTDGGATWATARPSQVHLPVYGFPGVNTATYTYRWDPRRDLPAGAYTAQLRARLVDAQASSWATSASLPIVVN